jgi:hypothetical protein
MAEMTDEQIAESVRTYTKRRVDDGDSIREWDFCDICGNQQFDRDHSSHSPTCALHCALRAARQRIAELEGGGNV